VNANLKTRMLDAAVIADQLWQPAMAKAITDGIAEIERLLQVLYEQGQRSAEVSKAMLSVLPYLRRIEQPTEEMFAAMTQGETPYIVQAGALDDEGKWFVFYLPTPDADYVTAYSTTSRADALEKCDQLQTAWRYSEMLRIAATQPVHSPEQPA
jgi:hypothetical protein